PLASGHQLLGRALDEQPPLDPGHVKPAGGLERHLLLAPRLLHGGEARTPRSVDHGHVGGVGAELGCVRVRTGQRRGIQHPAPATTGKPSLNIRPSFCPSGLSRVSARLTAAAVAPMRVPWPTATTTARAVPTVTSLPSSTTRLDSVPPSASLFTGTDSPVSA